MWTKIVEILLGKLLRGFERTPKQDLARDVVRLYVRMRECHQAYLTFRREFATRFLAAMQPDRTTKDALWKELAEQQDSWAEAIERLAESLYELRTVLGIFDGDVLAILTGYVNEESYAYHYSSRIMWSDDNRPNDMYMQVPMLAGFIGRSMPNYYDDPRKAIEQQDSDSADFKSAMEKLGSFIKDTLGIGPEEVRKAERHEWIP